MKPTTEHLFENNRARRPNPWWRIPLVVTLILTMALLAAGTGCSESGKPLTDDEKQQRIGELYQQDKESYFAGAPEISAAELMEWRETRRVILVDVREPEEQDVSMIPGAVRAQNFDPESVRGSGALVVAYCTIGTRSGIFVNDLIKRGIEAYNLAGSILSWTHAGGPLVDPNGEETKRVHVYGKKWNLAADGYETVW